MIGTPAARIRGFGAPVGRILDALTFEAAIGFLVTERHRRRAAWLWERVGDHHPAARGLALSVARARIGAGGWDMLPIDDRAGVPVIVIPVWESDVHHALGMVCVDMIAVDPTDPGRGHQRSGLAAALGEPGVESALVDGEPIRWHAAPLGWVRDGGDAREWGGEDPGPARFHPLPAGDELARRVLLGAREILADDDAHGISLEQEARALRRTALPPPPRFLTDAPVEEAA